MSPEALFTRLPVGILTAVVAGLAPPAPAARFDGCRARPLPLIIDLDTTITDLRVRPGDPARGIIGGWPLRQRGREVET